MFCPLGLVMCSFSGISLRVPRIDVSIRCPVLCPFNQSNVIADGCQWSGPGTGTGYLRAVNGTFALPACL